MISAVLGETAMKRQVIKIDEDKCTGCGLCIPNCPEGAIQLVHGKAKLVRDSLCDGLGACLGHCPEGAITFEERESEAYDERAVIGNIMALGEDAVRAHLRHLEEHGEDGNLKIALSVLKEEKMKLVAGTDLPKEGQHHSHGHGSCPGARSMSFREAAGNSAEGGKNPGGQPSGLTHWPIQLHLISPDAPHYHQKDLLLAADCVAFSMGNFHGDYLASKTLAIACPKLDEGQEIYLEKLKALIERAQINTLTVMTMEVPCCSGLLRLAQAAVNQVSRKIPLKHVMVGLRGDSLRESWI